MRRPGKELRDAACSAGIEAATMTMLSSDVASREEGTKRAIEDCAPARGG